MPYIGLNFEDLLLVVVEPLLKFGTLEEIAELKWFHLRVKVVDQRTSCRYLETKQILVAHSRQVLDESPQRITVADNNYALSTGCSGFDMILPDWEHPLNSHL